MTGSIVMKLFLTMTTGIILMPTAVAQATTQQPTPIKYSVTIKGFPYDSDANRIASYWYDNSKDLVMIASFMQEAHFNVNAKSKGGHSGLCQLARNKTNNKWLDDPRRKQGREFQARVCMEKRKAVPIKKNIRQGRYNHKKRIPSIVLTK